MLSLYTQYWRRRRQTCLLHINMKLFKRLWNLKLFFIYMCTYIREKYILQLAVGLYFYICMYVYVYTCSSIFTSTMLHHAYKLYWNFTFQYFVFFSKKQTIKKPHIKNIRYCHDPIVRMPCKYCIDLYEYLWVYYVVYYII